MRDTETGIVNTLLITQSRKDKTMGPMSLKVSLSVTFLPSLLSSCETCKKCLVKKLSIFCRCVCLYSYMFACSDVGVLVGGRCVHACACVYVYVYSICLCAVATCERNTSSEGQV